MTSPDDRAALTDAMMRAFYKAWELNDHRGDFEKLNAAYNAMRKVETASQPQPVNRADGDAIHAIAFHTALVLEMSELCDRNSPEDEPDAMIANSDEMEGCIERALERTGLSLRADGDAMPMATLVIGPNGSCSIHMPWTPDVQLGEGFEIRPLTFWSDQPRPMDRLESAAWSAAAKAGIDGEQFIKMLVDGGLDDLLAAPPASTNADARERFLDYWCNDIPDNLRAKWRESVNELLDTPNANEKLQSAWDAWKACVASPIADDAQAPVAPVIVPVKDGWLDDHITNNVKFVKYEMEGVYYSQGWQDAERYHTKKIEQDTWRALANRRDAAPIASALPAPSRWKAWKAGVEGQYWVEHDLIGQALVGKEGESLAAYMLASLAHEAIEAGRSPALPAAQPGEPK